MTGPPCTATWGTRRAQCAGPSWPSCCHVGQWNAMGTQLGSTAPGRVVAQVGDREPVAVPHMVWLTVSSSSFCVPTSVNFSDTCCMSSPPMVA
ncbi:unnamed protein product [Prorocentrum cordatum]|uniref:Subtilisin n=1 Tax=Prorocentrum cordatum TaxID=2364126 RepID=A0ABN9UJV2_9DINO|nr:unnamed protein product [Polarella glacialis]